MTTQPLRGFRDFYPQDQFTITYLRDKIAETCRLYGYEEFEGPAVESFELYAAKSSDEIVNEQAFVFEDRGESRITLRPELTPTLARMVAAQQNTLTFPVRWWSFGRFWRYERPQKGRAREFYQWNLDLLGENSPAYDVEILEIIISFLRNLGLTEQDVVCEINDRSFVNDQLAKLGVDEKLWPNVFKYLDRAPKLTDDEKQAFAIKLNLDLSLISSLVSNENAWEQSERLTEIMARLTKKGLDGWIKPNISIVRGFTYYTGLVFEVSDRAKEYRALLGGGRYSNLVAAVGGKPIDGIGMGMGDMVIASFLEAKGLLPSYTSPTDVCIVSLLDDTTYTEQVADQLRKENLSTVIFTTDNIGKGLKFANSKGIRSAVIIGPNEAETQTVTIKDLQTTEQQNLTIEEAIHALS